MTFLQQLSDAIDIQQQRQDQEYNELMSKPLQERVSRGYTMTNLHAEFEFYDGAPTRFTPAPTGTMRYIDRVRIRCEYNISKFREGTQVRLSHGSLSFVMEIERDDVNDFTLRSGAFEVKNNLLDIRDCPRDGWEINAVNSDITYRLLRATWENLYSHPDFCDHLERFLTGQFRNQYRESPSPTCGNPSQNEAIRKAFACNYFHLIQGPPGTGKTFTIAKIVYFLMKMGKKVFVTAPTHTAINNCLNAIANELQDKRFVVKVGERHQADEILHNPHITRKTSLKLRDYQSNPELSQAGFVAGGTPFALCYPASKKLEGWQFDYVIVDEAAQMSIPLALPAIMHGRRLVFVGDHQQLDPIVPQDTGNKFFDCSIFGQLADLYPQDVTLLDCSYRLNESLIHIPNQLFYDGRITAEHELQRPYTTFTCDAAPQIVNHPSNELLGACRRDRGDESLPSTDPRGEAGVVGAMRARDRHRTLRRYGGADAGPGKGLHRLYPLQLEPRGSRGPVGVLLQPEPAERGRHPRPYEMRGHRQRENFRVLQGAAAEPVHSPTLATWRGGFPAVL